MPYCYQGGNCAGRGDYYQGDYYQGDYYQGDPGLFSGIGKFIGGVVRTVGVGAGILPPQFAPAPGRPLPLQGTALAPAPKGVGIGYFAPGGGGFGAGVFPQGLGGPQVGIPGPLPGGLMNGKMRLGHYNKSTYVTRGGGTSHWPVGLAVHPKGTVCVPNRRMNAGNARALKHALRRAYAFARLARSAGFVQRHYKKSAAKKKKK